MSIITDMRQQLADKGVVERDTCHMTAVALYWRGTRLAIRYLGEPEGPYLRRAIARVREIAPPEVTP